MDKNASTIAAATSDSSVSALELCLDLTNCEPHSDTVTVAISVYNYAHYLQECLNSVKDQLHQYLDIVVVDDQSKDDSVAVACDWLSANSHRFGRVSVWRQEQNGGPAVAKNSAFEKSRSDLVMVLDADNCLYPRAISRLAYAIKQGKFSAAYSQLEKFGDEHCIGEADIWCPDYFKGENYIDGMALISKAAWKALGGFDSGVNGWEDYDLWCKYVENDLSAVFVPEILCRYRVHSNSVTGDVRKKLATLWSKMRERHPWV